MKYPALRRRDSEEDKTRTVVGFSDGIDDKNGEVATDNNALSDCVNMIFEEGVLKTRSGFAANEGSVIRFTGYNDTVYMPFTITETVYYKDSKPHKIAYSCMGDIAEAQLKMWLVDNNGNISPFGEIYIHRVDSETFNLPKNVFFVIADKISGCGVFAFVARGTESSMMYEIYELSLDHTTWERSDNDIYVPTVLINGRGERYAESDGYVGLNYPEPERPEEINLLGGRHKCYFTSDGLSSIFRLPYGHLGEWTSVSCRLYSSPQEYTEWVIDMGLDYDTKTIDGASIVFQVDRQLGIVQFSKDGIYYSVPLMPKCKLNNMLITVTTTEDIAKDSVISSKGAVTLDNRLYFYGNGIKQNCIYCSKMSNPLYVPQSSRLYLGDGTTPVTALRVQNGKLIAFKSGETYRVKTDFENDTVKKTAVLPESTVYLKGDTLTAQTIDSNIGCISDKTIGLCGSRLVWLGSDKRVYALATTTYGNTTNIYCVSHPINGRLKSAEIDNEKVFAVANDGKYMLFFDENIFLMNYRVRGFGYSRTYYAQDDTIKSPAWYFWKTPEGAKIHGGKQIGDSAVMAASFNNGDSFYNMVISGDNDSLMAYEEGQEVKKTQPIKSGFTTKIIELSPENRCKRIDCVFLNGKCTKKSKLTLSEGRRKSSYNIDFEESGDFIRIGAGMPFSNNVAVSLFANEAFRIRSLILKYKLLADKG